MCGTGCIQREVDRVCVEGCQGCVCRCLEECLEGVWGVQRYADGCARGV